MNKLLGSDAPKDRENVEDRRGEPAWKGKVRSAWELAKWAGRETDKTVADALDPRPKAFADTSGLPPLKDDAPVLQEDGLPPLQGPDMGSAQAGADAALGAPSQSRYAPIDTSTPLREPEPSLDVADMNVFPLPRQAREENKANTDYLIAQASKSSTAEEARKQLQLARDLNVDPDLIAGKTKEFEAAQQQEQFQRKIATLPAYSQLNQWMLRNRAQAAVIQKELDSWQTVDWLFGKFSYDPEDMQAWSRRHANGEEYGDYRFRPRAGYENPGWYQALGRSIYSMSTSVQNMFMASYGPDTKEAHERQLEQIKKQRDIAMFPIPGETVYMPDGAGGVTPAGKEHPVLRRANSLIGMAPLIGASMIHPALGAGLIYAESAGRTYEDMRLQGYEHVDAENAAQAVGFTNGAIAIATGGMFKFSFLPKATLGAMGQTSNAVLGSIGKNPTFWRGAMGLGKNFVWSTVMNMGMAANEVSIREAYDSVRQNRPYNFSKVTSAASDASDAWAEMLALSVMPAYKEHQARKVGYQANVERTQDQMDRARFVESVYNNYEDRGQSLRSMHEASQIVTAVQALKNSEFAKSNPEDARDLVQKLIAPRGSQTVYLRPEAVAKLPPDALEALGVHDVSLGANGGKIPVNLTDLILHPDGEALASQAAGGPDLQAASELGGVDLGVPSDAQGQNVPDEKLTEWLAAERERRRGRSTSRLPTDQEVTSAVQGALEQDVHAPRSAEGAMPPAGERRPAPDNGPRQRPSQPRPAPPPVTEDGLRRWALDAVGRIPTSELAAMAEEHGRRAEEANREEKDALRGERTPASETRADEAGRRHAVSNALHKALVSAVEETRSHVDYFSKQASEEPLPGGGRTPREAAWYAGQEYGAAHDAIMQATGLANSRSEAAPDLSDIYDKLARLNHLTKDGFEGWDLQASNQSISQRGTMPERSLEDLRMLRSVLEQLGKSADSVNSVRTFGIRVAKAQMRDLMAEHLKNLPELPPGQRMSPDDPRALSSTQGADKERGSIAAELNKPSTLMLKLGKIGEALWFEGFVPGTARENSMWSDVEPVIRAIDKEMPSEIRKLLREKVKFPDGSVQLRANVVDMVLKLGTQGTDSKVARGFGFSPYDIPAGEGKQTITAEQQLWDWVHSNLSKTPEQAHTIMDKLVTPHWKLFENYLWPQIQKMFAEQGLAPPEKLKPSTMTIHGKEYQGNYGGRLKWLEARNKPVVNPGSFEALLGSDVSGPYTDQRHLAERDPEFAGHPLFSWDGLVSDIKKEIHDVAMRPFLEDAHKVFSDGEIRQLIGNKMGNASLNQIYNPSGMSDWLHTVARGGVADVQSAKTWAQRLFKFQGLAAYSAFSLNSRVMLGQLSHIPAAMFGMDTNPIHATEGFAAAFNPDRRSWAHAASEVLRLRYANYEDRAIELTRQLTGLEPGRDAVRRATDHANWMAWREMDAFLSHAIWEAAYSKAVGRYQVGGEVASHDAAVRAGDTAVTRMMPAQDIYDQSAFVRDRSIAGFSYMVRNFPNTLANVAALNWWSARLQGGAGTWQGGAARAKASAQFVGMVMAAEILGKGFIMQGGPREQDEPEKWYQARLFGAMSYPYMISEPVNATWMALQGDRHGARQEMDRMMPASIGVMAQGIDDIGRFMQNGDEEAGFRAAAHLSGLLLKTPLTGIGYNLSNAVRNSQSPLDAVMKGMGYRQ